MWTHVDMLFPWGRPGPHAEVFYHRDMWYWNVYDADGNKEDSGTESLREDAMDTVEKLLREWYPKGYIPRKVES